MEYWKAVMRKGKFLIFGIIFFYLITVRASGDAQIFIDCKDNKVKLGDSLVCDVVLMYDNVSISNISFNYQTDLELTFLNETNFVVENNNYQVNITPSSELSKNLIDPIKIGTMKISTSNSSKGEYDIKFTNINFLDTDDNTYTMNSFSKTINVHNDELDSDCNLLSITVNGKLIDGFSPTIYDYDNIYVDTQIIFVDAVRSSNNSNASGLGSVRVAPNTTITRVVHVVAENGDVHDYTLQITNGENPNKELPLADALSDDNSLKELELYYQNEKIDFNFDSNKTIYSVRLSDSKIDKLTIKATLNDNKANFVSKFGPRDVNINYGDNVVELKVNAENKTLRTYTLNISKEDNRSNDNSLFYLQVNGHEIILVENVFDYSISLSESDTKTDIRAVANNSLATVSFENIDLVEGVNAPIEIIVKAENGDTKTYTVRVTRLSKEEENVELELISVVGYDLNFDINSYFYDINLKNNEDKLDIVINPDNIQSNIVGNSDLVDNSKIIITVFTSSGERSYTINIHKEDDSKFSFVYYFIFGVGVITFLASTLYAIKINKKK